MIISSVALDNAGRFLRSDGSPMAIGGREVNINEDQWHAVELVFPRLGEPPCESDKTPPPARDLWDLTETAAHESLEIVSGTANFPVSVLDDSRYRQALLAGDLRIDRANDKLNLYYKSDFLGSAPVDYANSCDLGVAVPALNYGGSMQAMIRAKFDALSEIELMDLFLNREAAFRRSLKPLALFTQDYFSYALVKAGFVMKLLGLLNAGIALTNQDSWQSREQTDELAVAAALAALQADKLPPEVAPPEKLEEMAKHLLEAMSLQQQRKVRAKL